MSSAEWLWRSGDVVKWQDATIHVRSVGHASVSSVFEGVNAYRAHASNEVNVFRLTDHAERLERSTRLARLEPTFDAAVVRAAVPEILRRNDVHEDTHVRPWTFAAGNPLEQMVDADVPTETVIDSWPFSSGLGTGRVKSAAFTAWRRVGVSTMPPDVKAFANYHNGRLGNIDARGRSADWPIFLNSQEQVTESSGANVAIVSRGRILTPPVSAGILRGVTRETLLTLAREDLEMDASEAVISRTDVLGADEVMFWGTSAEVLPIVRVDGMVIGDGGIGPVTASLQREYSDVLRGRRPARSSWLTPVWGLPR